MANCYGSVMHAAQTALRKACSGVLDLLLPPRCPLCRDIVPVSGNFCAGCWNRLDFLTAPMCACCGFPFPYDVGEAALCGECAAEPPAYDTARAALVYNEASADLVLGLKYGDRTQLSRIMAAMMARAARESLEQAPLIVPVPLHRRRLRQRFFNQAALIAAALGKRAGIPVCVDAMLRIRDTPPSKGMSRKARFDNVKSAIRVAAHARSRVAGRRILLVDDVMTTGATAGVCARQLKRVGALRVDIVTFARVTHDGAR